MRIRNTCWNESLHFPLNHKDHLSFLYLTAECTAFSHAMRLVLLDLRKSIRNVLLGVWAEFCVGVIVLRKPPPADSVVPGITDNTSLLAKVIAGKRRFEA